MKNFYAKNDYYGYEPTVDHKYGIEDTGFRANYEIKIHDSETPYLERNTSQFSFGRGNDGTWLSDSLDHLNIKKEEKTSLAYNYDLPYQQVQPTYQHETYTSSLPKPWEAAKPWDSY